MLRWRLGLSTRSVSAGPSGWPGRTRVRLLTPGRVTAAVAAACCLVVGMVVAAPLVAASGGRAATFLYEVFAPVCHQIAERSFHLAGHPLAVCHRCFGFYAGFTLGLIVLPLVRPARDWLLDEPRRILLLLAPTAVDWLLPMNTPTSRSVTAVLAGAGIAVLIWAAIGQMVQQMPRNLPPGEAVGRSVGALSGSTSEETP